jgi:hypothetical protein
MEGESCEVFEERACRRRLKSEEVHGRNVSGALTDTCKCVRAAGDDADEASVTVNIRRISQQATGRQDSLPGIELFGLQALKTGVIGDRTPES